MPERARATAGFTLLEVTIAVFVVAVVMGSLITLVSQNLARLADARREVEALVAAEAQMREIQERAAAGELPGVGTRRGFDEEAGLEWELLVEPWAVPAPATWASAEPAPSVFDPTVLPGRGPRLLRVSLRVYPEEADPEAYEPFVAIVASPPEPSLPERGAS